VNLELVIREAVAEAITRELTPLLEPFINKLRISDKGVEEEFLTAPEAAKLLKVSPITMSIWRHEKRGPEYVVIGNGRGIRYKRSALLEFIERNGSLIGKRGRPSKDELDARGVATSGVTTGRVKKTAKAEVA
jgi:hypothetical protein